MQTNYLISTNPARGYSEIGRVPISTSAEIIRAVSAAKAAWPAWCSISVTERAAYFLKFRELIKGNLEAIASLQTQEMGKPITESIGECKAILHWLKLHIELAPKALAPQPLDRGDDFESLLYFEPYGVAAVITPWNYPTYQFVVNIGQSLLAGNTVVLKHSEECPLTAAFLAALIKDAGFPEGVFQCLNGAGDVGRELINQNVNFISFTGSSSSGKQIYEQAGKRFLPAIMEMGGFSPGIIFEDAVLKTACSSVVNERFRNCGQICCALKRLIVHQSVYKTLVNHLKIALEAQIVGDPMDKNTTVGPLAAKRQLELLEEQVEDARASGATVITGGMRVAGLDGAFYAPTLVVDIDPKSRLWSEEVFGPVLPVVSFSSEEEAISIANNTPYGLSAFIYTEDQARALRVAARLEAGQVSINGSSYFTDHAPFGGYKASGIGRIDGAIGYSSVTQMKVVSRPPAVR